MDKKICEVKLEDLKTVIGGAAIAVSTSVGVVKPVAAINAGALTNKLPTGFSFNGLRF